MTTMLAAPTAPATPLFGSLTLSDRCDRCNAQGFVRVVIDIPGEFTGAPQTDLVFCGHHANRYAVDLAKFEVRDETGRINQKPTDAKASNGF